MSRIGYSYTRFSTAVQTSGDSQRRQDQLAISYATRHSITLDTSLNLRDQGLSAFSSAHKKRGNLGKFLAAIESGKIKPGSLLLIEAVDRLSREHPITAMDTISQIVRAGVEIVTCEDDTVYSMATLDSGAMQILAGKLEQARMFSKRHSRRMNGVWEEKKLSGTVLTKLAPGWLKVVDDKYEVIESRAAVVRRIFEETAAGLGRERIAKRLNQEGIPTFSRAEQGVKVKKVSTSQWHTSTIQSIIKTRSALGYYQPHELRVANGRKRVAVGEERLIYPPVIDAALWERATASMKTRASTGGEKVLECDNLLKGIAKCAHCMGTMTYMRRAPRNPRSQEMEYLACYDATRGGLCANKNYYRYKLVELLIIDTLMAFNAFDPTLFEVNDAKLNDLSKRIASANDEKNKIAKQIANITEAIGEHGLKSLISKLAELEKNYSKLDEKISDLKDEIALATNESPALNLNKIAQLRALAESDGKERIDARLVMSQALKALIEGVYFNHESNSALVILHGFIMSIRIVYEGRKRNINACVDSILFHAGEKSFFLNGDGEIEKFEDDNQKDFVDYQISILDPDSPLMKRIALRRPSNTFLYPKRLLEKSDGTATGGGKE